MIQVLAPFRFPITYSLSLVQYDWIVSVTAELNPVEKVCVVFCRSTYLSPDAPVKMSESNALVSVVQGVVSSPQDASV